MQISWQTWGPALGIFQHRNNLADGRMKEISNCKAKNNQEIHGRRPRMGRLEGISGVLCGTSWKFLCSRRYACSVKRIKHANNILCVNKTGGLCSQLNSNSRDSRIKSHPSPAVQTKSPTSYAVYGGNVYPRPTLPTWRISGGLQGAL